MFSFLFGWHKASKCKKLIKRVQCRITILKSKRYVIAKQLRDDIAQLLKIGNEESAFNRAEQVIKDENIMSVYGLLYHFCEFIIINLSYIRKNKDCPNDINEAISTLVFVSSRCGDLPELPRLRKLFGQRYGSRFSNPAVEKFPGNLVNHEIKEKLSLNPVPDCMKFRLLNEITRDYCIRPEILAMDYTSELQEQVNEIEEKLVAQVEEIQTCHRETDGSLVRSSNEIKRASNDIVGPLLSSTELYSRSHQASDAISTSITSSIAQQSSQDALESPEHRKSTILYLDDVTEFKVRPETRDFSSLKSKEHDQRLFKFKVRDIWSNQSQDETLDVKSKENFNSNVDDVQSAMYYAQQHRNNRFRQHKRQSNKTQTESEIRSKNFNREVHRETGICSLNRPCYFGTCYDKDPIEMSRGPRKPRRERYDKDANTASNLWCKESEKRGQGCRSVSSCASSTELHGNKPIRLEVQRAPYTRAMTMPQKRGEESCREGILRSSSCWFEENRDHVHPKLPDYDDIAAKFNALKKHHLENKDE